MKKNKKNRILQLTKASDIGKPERIIEIPVEEPSYPEPKPVPVPKPKPEPYKPKAPV